MSKLGEQSVQRGRIRGSATRKMTRLGGGKRVNQSIGGAALDRCRFETVMKAAERAGLLGQKNSRITGRVSQSLVQEAKRRTGIERDTELIAFALANVALEGNFAGVFKRTRGKTDPDLKLGFGGDRLRS